ncbi:MAG: O-antigen ligase family protein [Hyphomicrobiales bacterium]|nr:O-antigen ligase family protein [Hyphomicrobiales bacterium]
MAAVLVVTSLPWSTSATIAAIALWLIVLVPTLDLDMLRREVSTPAGLLPLLVFVLAAIGTLWSEGSWSERISGLLAFDKLLIIPLLLAQFRRSPHLAWVLGGFFVSLVVLLAASYFLAFAPGLAWRGQISGPGVPVKDYIAQSGFFVICIFGLLGFAAERWGTDRPRAIAALLLALLFLANIVFVSTGRTALVTAVVLLVPFAFRYLGARGLLLISCLAVVLAAVGWVSSSYLRARVTAAVDDIRAYRQLDTVNSVGLRLEYWRRASQFVAEAPLFGRGTGSILELYRRSATEGEGAAASVTVNPHNQVIAVAIQLGLVGTALLIAMWIAHLALFRWGPLVSWLGLVIVIQNIVGSQLNSHLFDFTQGWLYVFGVGIAGGAVRRARAGPLEAAADSGPGTASRPLGSVAG